MLQTLNITKKAQTGAQGMALFLVITRHKYSLPVSQSGEWCRRLCGLTCNKLPCVPHRSYARRIRAPLLRWLRLLTLWHPTVPSWRADGKKRWGREQTGAERLPLVLLGTALKQTDGPECPHWNEPHSNRYLSGSFPQLLVQRHGNTLEPPSSSSPVYLLWAPA